MYVCDGFLYRLSVCGGFLYRLLVCSGFFMHIVAFKNIFAHIDNKKKTILVLGVGPTQGLENTLITEKNVFN